jgi:hypothetical protein
MTTPMAGDENDRLTIECAKAEFVGCSAKRTFDPPPLSIRDPIDLVEPAASDDADYWPGHPRFSEPGPRSCA